MDYVNLCRKSVKLHFFSKFDHGTWSEIQKKRSEIVDRIKI